MLYRNIQKAVLLIGSDRCWDGGSGKRFGDLMVVLFDRDERQKTPCLFGASGMKGFRCAIMVLFDDRDERQNGFKLRREG